MTDASGVPYLTIQQLGRMSLEKFEEICARVAAILPETAEVSYEGQRYRTMVVTLPGMGREAMLHLIRRVRRVSSGTHLHKVLPPEDAPPAPKPVAVLDDSNRHLLDMPLRELELSLRVVNLLEQGLWRYRHPGRWVKGIWQKPPQFDTKAVFYTGELVRLVSRNGRIGCPEQGGDRGGCIDGIGPALLAEIEAVLWSCNLTFGMDVGDWRKPEMTPKVMPPAAVMRMPLAEMGLKPRTLNVLRNSGFEVLGDVLVEYSTKADFLQSERHGLSLAGRHDFLAKLPEGAVFVGPDFDDAWHALRRAQVGKTDIEPAG